MSDTPDLFQHDLDRNLAVPVKASAGPRSGVSCAAIDATMICPNIGFLRIGFADFEQCVRLARKWLMSFETGKSKETPLQNLFTSIELAVEKTNEPSDILLQALLRFGPNEVPKWTPNGCRALGRILEKMIKILFKSAFPHLFQNGAANARVSKAVSEALEDAKGTKDYEELSKPAKFQVDLLLRRLALEIKYRCANGQGSTEQGRGAKLLTHAGFFPTMLILRPSANTQAYNAKGWLTAEAQMALDVIYQYTGIDFIAFMQAVVCDPKIEFTITSGRKKIFRNAAKGISYQINHYRKEFHEEAPAEMKTLEDDMLAALDHGHRDGLLERLIARSTPEELISIGHRFLAAAEVNGASPSF